MQVNLAEIKRNHCGVVPSYICSPHAGALQFLSLLSCWGSVFVLGTDFSQYFCEQTDDLCVNCVICKYKNSYHKYKRFLKSKKYLTSMKQICKHTNKCHKLKKKISIHSVKVPKIKSICEYLLNLYNFQTGSCGSQFSAFLDLYFKHKHSFKTNFPPVEQKSTCITRPFPESTRSPADAAVSTFQSKSMQSFPDLFK